MLDIKTILCPTDFSDPAAEAVETARSLAARFGAKLRLLHVLEVTPLPPYPTAHIGATTAALDTGDIQKAQLDHAEEAMARLVESQQTKEVEISSAVKQGRPATVIAEEAKNEKVDLIVIATHGTSGWKRFLFGSVADKVVRTSPCPVLTLNKDERD